MQTLFGNEMAIVHTFLESLSHSSILHIQRNTKTRNAIYALSFACHVSKNVYVQYEGLSLGWNLLNDTPLINFTQHVRILHFNINTTKQ